MKRFDSFGEYMFSLLFAPLKKTRRAANQFAIFFRVVGREFDDLKEAVLRVRDEANVASASAVMLPIHGQDRNMPRLAGETDEGYRTRLSMKGIIASWAGTGKGVRYAMAALGYEHSAVEPVSPRDPARWAEFVVNLGFGSHGAVEDFSIIRGEIEKVKEGSSKLAYLILPHEPILFIYQENVCLYRFLMLSMRFSHLREAVVRWDGSVDYDGEILFNQMPAGIRLPAMRFCIRLRELRSRSIRWDGSVLHDGTIDFGQQIGSGGSPAFGVRLRAPHALSASVPELRLGGGMAHPSSARVSRSVFAAPCARHEGHIGGAVTMDNWRGMDGGLSFDGTYKFDAYLKKEEL
ncbi:MAG: hypothetical protein K2L38_03600 [Dysosmobacter sp.]|nr:hypothetical protein [Dysosmobacter sp.]